MVLCESVATFIKGKQQVAREYARVTKPGGYVGLNEEVWLKTPPPHLLEDVRRLWDIKPEIPTVAAWLELLGGAGLRDIAVRTHTLDSKREATQIKRYRLGDMWRMTYRSLALYLGNRAFREYMKDRRRLPKGVFDYLGYALFVGRK